MYGDDSKYLPLKIFLTLTSQLTFPSYSWFTSWLGQIYIRPNHRLYPAYSHKDEQLWMGFSPADGTRETGCSFEHQAYLAWITRPGRKDSLPWIPGRNCWRKCHIGVERDNSSLRAGYRVLWCSTSLDPYPKLFRTDCFLHKIRMDLRKVRSKSPGLLCARAAGEGFVGSAHFPLHCKSHACERIYRTTVPLTWPVWKVMVLLNAAQKASRWVQRCPRSAWQVSFVRCFAMG